jgi:hypothetical protein
MHDGRVLGMGSHRPGPKNTQKSYGRLLIALLFQKLKRKQFPNPNVYLAMLIVIITEINERKVK